MRLQFQLNDEQFKALMEAAKPVAMIALQCGTPSSPQENANRAWQKLGDELGFDGMTVEPSPKGDRFFIAVVNQAKHPHKWVLVDMHIECACGAVKDK